jgi:hypothetical protein
MFSSVPLPEFISLICRLQCCEYETSVSNPHRVYADPDVAFSANADPTYNMNVSQSQQIVERQIKIIKFNNNKDKFEHLLSFHFFRYFLCTITVLWGFFPLILAILTTGTYGSGYPFGIRIRIQNVNNKQIRIRNVDHCAQQCCGSGTQIIFLLL